MFQKREKIAVTVFGLALLCGGFASGWLTHKYNTLPMPNFQTTAALATSDVNVNIVTLSKEKDLWVVSVRLNGERDLRFLLDTGASTTMLRSAIAQALGIKAGAMTQGTELAEGTVVDMPLARVTSLQIGEITFLDVKIVLGNPPQQLDGILGNDLLSLFRITIDPVNKVLIFSNPQGGA